MVNVLYEDNHIIAVMKPAGIPVQKGGKGQSLDLMVKDYLKTKYKKPGNVFLGIVHRLDQPVSGIILFAKTSKGASRLSEQFREKELEKTYRAVLTGKLKNKKGVLKSRIRKERSGYFRAIVEGPAYGEPVTEKGREAELEYRIVKEGAKKQPCRDKARHRTVPSNKSAIFKHRPSGFGRREIRFADPAAGRNDRPAFGENFLHGGDGRTKSGA